MWGRCEGEMWRELYRADPGREIRASQIAITPASNLERLTVPQG